MQKGPAALADKPLGRRALCILTALAVLDAYVAGLAGGHGAVALT